MAPEVVRVIAAAGHEVQSHGYGHVEVFKLTEEQFRKNVTKELRRVAETCEQVLKGPSAPSPRSFGEAVAYGRPEEAARAAKRAWFESRLRRGQTPTKIAEELGIAPQSVREQLRRLGLGRSAAASAS